MEVARRLRRGRVAPAWRGLADAVAGFLGEAAFRLWLTYNVLVGRAPIEAKKRP